MKIKKEVRAYCTNEPGQKKGDEEMLCIGNNQPTEEFPVEANEAFQDAEDRGESAERVKWNQAQYKPEKRLQKQPLLFEKTLMIKYLVNANANIKF